MKKTLFGATLIVALAASSCSKVETVDINQEAVDFSVTTNATTKGTSITASGGSNAITSFSATGWNHSATWATVVDTSYGTATLFMTDDKFSVEGSDATPTSSYFLPSGYMSFFAYNDDDIDLSSYTPATATTGYGYPSFDYTVAKNATTADTDNESPYEDNSGAIAVADLDDLLIGSVMDQTGTSIAFALDHALAKVSFKAIGDNSSYKYNVTAVRMNDVATTDKFTYANTNDGVDGSWTSSTASSLSGSAHYVLTGLTKEIAIGAAAATELTDGTTDEFIIMPQTFKGWLLVKYEVEYTTTSKSTSAWATVKLTNGVNFAAGSHTIFSLTLPSEGGNVSNPTDPETEFTQTTDKMTFTVSSVGNWADSTTTDIPASDL